RGWSSPSAKASTRSPGAGVGFSPACQPTTLATFTVGKSVLLGGGSLGCGPVPSATVRDAVSPQAESSRVVATSRTGAAIRTGSLRHNERAGKTGELPGRSAYSSIGTA